MSSLQREKATLRREMQEKIQKISESARISQSKAICQRIQNSQQWKRANNLLLYFPMKDEPNIKPLLVQSILEGKLLYLPQFDPATQAYSIAPVRDLKKEMRSGKYGIQEPTTSAVAQKEIDMILVPGLCFDTTGARLGRGKGFYDRLLTQISGFKCGVCWKDTCLFNRLIPVEFHDARVDTCWYDL